jgi:hypothetical protein
MLPFTDLSVDVALGAGRNRAPTSPARRIAVMFTLWADKIA